jgi:multidrug efflux pump subunit AcrA (membrane-fusion protein)
MVIVIRQGCQIASLLKAPKKIVMIGTGMKQQHRQHFVSLMVLFGLLLSSFGCSASAESIEQATPTPYPTAIIPTKPTYVVERGEVIEEMQFTARVAPVVQKALFFRTDGRVRGVYVEQGDPVEAGQVLADLEFLDDLERQLASDQLRLRRAEIQVNNAQIILDLYKQSKPAPEMVIAQASKDLADAQQAVEKAERALGITQSTANQASIDAAYAQVILAEQALERARDNFEPFANKPENNLTRAQLQAALSAAEQSYDAAVNRYNAMTGTSNQSAQNLAAADLAVAQAQLLAVQVEWERVQSNPIPKGYEEELALKENDLELAQIAYEETAIGVSDIEAAIADSQLVAPFDGVVTNLRVTDGRAVEAFKEYAVVADLTQLDLSANLTSEEMQKLEEGMPVTAGLSSRPSETFVGEIRYLPYGITIDATEEEKTTRITLDIDPEEAGLSEGDLVRVTVVLEQKADVLWLPPQAIRTFEGRRFVVVQEDGFQQRVDVKVGIEGDDRVEIEEGLKEGQIVVSP